VAAAGGSSSVEFRREDLTNLRLPEVSFKHAFSWGVIIHIREAERALGELARVVAPGGSLALYVTNNESWDKKLEDLVRRSLRRPLHRENHEPPLWVAVYGTTCMVRSCGFGSLTSRHWRQNWRNVAFI
jgi:ubiquinone/menaquinone biosynthesis C-methylase UbiE